MLLAAGYAPRYPERELADVAMRRISVSLQRMLDLHHPYPGVVIDRRWNVLLTNPAVTALTAGLPDHVLAPTPNVFRMCMHPDGLAATTVNFEEWAIYLLRQLRRIIVLTGDGGLIALESEVHAYPNVARVMRRAATDVGEELGILVPFVISSNGAELSFFTTLTTFGTPLDVTLDEIAIELFFPADDTTEAALRA
jgi:hypothetical protein